MARRTRVAESTTKLYRDIVYLEDHHDVESVEEKIREYGSADRVIALKFEIEADDAWDLHEMLSSLEGELGSYGINFIPNKESVVR